MKYVLEPNSVNPRWEALSNSIDISPKYDINSPYPVDHTEYGPRTFYLNSRLIKRAGVETAFTQDMIEEIQRCKNDIVYFAMRHFYIRSLDHGKIKIPLYDYQKFWLRASETPGLRFKQWLAARQSAKSTSLTIEMLHDIIFNEVFEAGIVAQKGSAAYEIFSRVRMAYEMLPFYMQPGVIDFAKGGVHLANGSKIFASSSTSDSLRGRSLSSVLVDEAAFVKNMDDFMRSTFPTISSGTRTKFTLVSTPNGRKGFFYQNWKKALEGGNDYFTLLVPWHRVPGRDEAWKKAEIERTDLLSFRQEHSCDFLGTSKSLIDPHVLEDAEQYLQSPIEIDEDVEVFENPIKDHKYIMTVDTAEGKNQDSSVFTIFDATKIPYTTVAIFKSAKISPMLFPYHIVAWAKDYNNALVIIENNNSSGAVVSRIVHHEIEYDELYCEHIVDDTGVGLRTTSKTKSLGCITLKNIMKQKALKILSGPMHSELLNFEQSGNSYAAAEGCNDDMAMTLVIFAYFTQLPDFIENYSDGVTLSTELYADEGNAILSAKSDVNEIIVRDSDSSFW